MSKPFTINGETYDFPANREPAGWGEDATDWAEAVTGVLANVSGTGDILQTQATIANNQAAAANVTGMAFDPTTVRGAVVDYTVYRVTTGGGATELGETGTMYINYLSTAGTYDFVVVGGASAGVTFTITSGGQVQYTSTNITGSAYSGTIKFRGRALTI